MAPRDHDLLQRARMALIEDARRAKKCMSVSEWVDVARETEAGLLVGPTELRAIVNVVWSMEP